MQPLHVINSGAEEISAVMWRRNPCRTSKGQNRIPPPSVQGLPWLSRCEARLPDCLFDDPGLSEAISEGSAEELSVIKVDAGDHGDVGMRIFVASSLPPMPVSDDRPFHLHLPEIENAMAAVTSKNVGKNSGIPAQHF